MLTVPDDEALLMPLPDTFEEAALRQHVRGALTVARAAFIDGDPFERATMHKHLREMLKALAEEHERNAAYVLKLALAGFEDAHEALADLLAERGNRGEPLGSALSTFANLLGGATRFRQPAVKPPASYLANFVIICLVIDLMQQFPGLRLRRNPAGRRPAAFSVVAAVLNEAKLFNGSAEAVRKIFEDYGPPSAPPLWAKAWPPQKK